jgi:murein DD-endopeptidase MepM/ murein hydrolase activator NlpD
MKKVKYVYNNSTLQFEEHALTLRQKAFRFLSQLSAIVFTGLIFYFAFAAFFPSPNEKALQEEISRTKLELQNLNLQLDKYAASLSTLHEKDNQVYKMIFNESPVDEGVWEGGTGGHDKYKMYENLTNTGEIIKSAHLKLDKITRQADIQNKSLEKIFSLASSREQKLASIPSIKPVRSDKLKKEVEMLSGFGMRLHPVHKIKKMHTGIDFTAPEGTAIQATGEGIIESVNSAGRGYGNSVVINHGFGYKTLYAHMKSVGVRTGQKVKKGQQIGTVGSTGTSTAPHLHYEVLIGGKHVNPIDFVLDGLTPQEYLLVVKKASASNQSWD